MSAVNRPLIERTDLCELLQRAVVESRTFCEILEVEKGRLETDFLNGEGCATF